MLICETCGEVVESVSEVLLSKWPDIVQLTWFVSDRHMIEVHGGCVPCAEKGSTA